MTDVLIRPARASDSAAIVALNQAEERATSRLDAARWNELAQLATHCVVADVGGQVVAFLIAMRDGVPYVNDNFAWFSARLSRFLYVDRIVVDSAHAGLRIGSRLYEDLFRVAKSRGIATIACEYNLDPPNPASRRFHDKFGFREVGQQLVAGGAKRVSLQTAPVS
jgi:uncharacterized protein